MAEARFQVGDCVRVRKGVVDPDYPDFPLGGWRGEVIDVDADAIGYLYLVEWDEETLDEAHEVYFNRADFDDTDSVEFTLREADLEPANFDDDLDMVQPTKLVPRPLDLSVPEERMLSILGMTCDDGSPDFDEDTLELCHDHFARVLKFPLAANLDMSVDSRTDLRPVLALRLLPADEAHETLGLLVEVADADLPCNLVPLASLRLAPSEPAFADHDAYLRWVAENLPVEPPTFRPPSLRAILVKVALIVLLLGVTAGAALPTVWGAFWGAIAGATLFAILGFLFGARLEAIARAINGLPEGGILGPLLGFSAGAAFGTVVGTMVVGFYGAIPGAILLALLFGLFKRSETTLLVPVTGAALGTLAIAFWIDWYEALIGAGWGLLAGCAVVLLSVGVARYLRPRAVS